jgi:hypothetical protein
MHDNYNNCIKNRFVIEERRRQVASFLSQSKTETEIAQILGVDQGTISRDVKVLKELSNQFVYDLAKSSLAYYYQQCIEGIEQVNRKAWEMYNNDSDDLSAKDRLLALKIIIDANQAKFGLFERGPNIMNIRALEERLNKVESRSINSNINGNPNQQAFQTT